MIMPFVRHAGREQPIELVCGGDAYPITTTAALRIIAELAVAIRLNEASLIPQPLGTRD